MLGERNHVIFGCTAICLPDTIRVRHRFRDVLVSQFDAWLGFRTRNGLLHGAVKQYASPLLSDILCDKLGITPGLRISLMSR
jgi:hypothetical protein